MMGGKHGDKSPVKERRPLSIIVESDDSSDEDKVFNKKICKKVKTKITECVSNENNNNVQQKVSVGYLRHVDDDKVDNVDVDNGENETLNDSDLQVLKQVTTRLKLSTRRQSYTVWKSEFIDRSPRLIRANKPRLSMDNTDNKLTKERKQRIDDALDWLRKELQDMRVQDQELARQFLSLKQDIQQLKLTKSCEEHQDMLDDAQCELEELNDLPDVLDLPAYGIRDNPLKHIGVTRMNIHSRRFSTC